MKRFLFLLCFSLCFATLQAQDTATLLASKAWTSIESSDVGESVTTVHFNKDNSYKEAIKMNYHDGSTVIFEHKGIWKMQENGECLITLTDSKMEFDMPDLDEETKNAINKVKNLNKTENPNHYDVRIVSISEDELSIRKKMSPNAWDSKWVYAIQYQ
ncbi:hypothetical protein QWY31_06485 [Cytophagales bacterium LB-30]|uniref:Lipocalin-like domain-containing protein n=1 Tax=Shiella aurantiaca TaxID=3058365 RepID=A0ABT8F417_9BACT|nr:hypothetical protein [Shiella aurantiaca]MDN4165140.1 hypothetical protein [Shiella aurantiaca]